MKHLTGDVGHIRKSLISTLSVLALSALSSFAVDFIPTTFTDSNVAGSGSLRDAVRQANGSPTADRILLSAGTYSLSITGVPEQNNVSGDLDIKRPTGSQPLVILGAGAGVTIIDATGLNDRVFNIVNSNAQVVFQDLTIIHGTAIDSGGLTGTAALGGAILINGGNVTLDHVVLDSNTAKGAPGTTGVVSSNGSPAQGGGIYLASGSLTVTNSTISNCSAAGGIGGAGFFGAGGASATTLTPPGTSGGNGGNGGDGAPGADGLGGAIYVASGTLSVSNSTLSVDTATGGAGGNGGDGGSGGDGARGFDASNNSQGGNGGNGGSGGNGGNGGAGGNAQGGGIFILSATATVVQATVSGCSANPANGGTGGLAGTGGLGGAGGNGFPPGTAGVNGALGTTGSNGTTGSSRGGGILTAGGTLSVDNSTIAFNTSSGSGNAGGLGNAGATVTSASTIYAGNNATKNPDIGGGIAASHVLVQSVLLAGGTNFTGNPLLGSLANNGGPTLTYLLGAGSPAMGNGSNPDNLTTDQRGFARVFLSSIDIGSTQTQPQTPTVTNAITPPNTQSTSGLVITTADTTTTAYQITNITGGTLFQNDGVTPINNGDFISVAQGAAGLKFTPNANITSGSFDVQAATLPNSADLGGGIAVATITIGIPPPGPGAGGTFSASPQLNITSPLSFTAPTLPPAPGMTVTFSIVASVANGTITSYLWNFGDGTITYGGATMTHVYTGEGNYQVSLQINGLDAGTIVVQVAVPVVDLGIIPLGKFVKNLPPPPNMARLASVRTDIISGNPGAKSKLSRFKLRGIATTAGVFQFKVEFQDRRTHLVAQRVYKYTVP